MFPTALPHAFWSQNPHSFRNEFDSINFPAFSVPAECLQLFQVDLDLYLHELAVHICEIERKYLHDVIELMEIRIYMYTHWRKTFGIFQERLRCIFLCSIIAQNKYHINSTKKKMFDCTILFVFLVAVAAAHKI